MAIVQSVELVAAAQWPQADIRSPLGVWGARTGVIGTSSSGGITVTIRQPAARRAAYVYVCHKVTIAQTAGAIPAGEHVSCRLLTNWPDISSAAGVQGYASHTIAPIIGNADLTSENAGPERELIAANDRFILLFDPRATGGALDIIELEWSINVNNNTYVFEAYGYFWDRSVLEAPGGPRFPGAN